jgi:hypothetical protein
MNGRFTWRVSYSAILLLILACFGAVFLYFVGIDALEGRNDFEFFVDSETYHEMVGDGLGFAEAIAVGGNFLGPLLILNVTSANYYLILLVNVALMFLAVRLMARTLELHEFKLLLVLLLNPITISSLLSVNKEIISLVVLALVIRGFKARSLLAFMLALPLSLLVRWQLTLFVLALLGVTGIWNPLRQHRWLTLAVSLLFLSFLYVKMSLVFEGIQENFDASVAEYEGSGFFEFLVRLQGQGLYWLVFPLKAAHLLFGMGVRFDRLINPTVFYNDVFQVLHSAVTLLTFIALVKWGRARLGNDLVYISAVYILVFAMSPIYAPRYFYPVFVLWALALVSPSALPRVFQTRPIARGGSKPVAPHPEAQART